MTRELAGHCHCGAIRAILTPGVALGELPYRACQCGFCRRHGAATTSHPESRLHIEAAPGAIDWYHFGRGVSDVLICEACGVYVASTIAADGGRMATLNVRGLDLPGFEDRTPEPVTYDDETDQARLARRKSRWTPTVIVEAQPSI